MVNLGNAGLDAIKELRNDKNWKQFSDALHTEVVRKMNAAIDTGALDAVGYARACRDLWLACEGATQGKNPNQIAKPATGKTNA